jgi:hypothetical protein
MTYHVHWTIVEAGICSGVCITGGAMGVRLDRRVSSWWWGAAAAASWNCTAATSWNCSAAAAAKSRLL